MTDITVTHGLDPWVHGAVGAALDVLDCRVKPAMTDITVTHGLDPWVHVP